jgi:hypothetical protein
MDNRYRPMIETPGANLAISMRQPNGIYTQKFNRRNHKASHVFQGRSKRLQCKKEITFLNSAGMWS